MLRFIPWALVLAASAFADGPPLFDGSPKSSERSRYRAVVGTAGMVASDDAIGSEWGAEILRRGGNAVDAAVATAFALAVTRPHYASLGGGGFLIYCPPALKSDSGAAPSECMAIDYREVAPKAATRDMFVRDGKGDTRLSQVGALASGVPGVTAGLTLAHARWGTRPLKELLSKPIELARKGIKITGWLEHSIVDRWGDMNPEAKRLFGCEPTRGKPRVPCPVGSLLKQVELADLLSKISAKGGSAFYEGDFARRLVGGVRGEGGILTVEDLKGYEPKIRKPVVGAFKGFEVIAMPPPSAGGTMMMQLLGYFERAAKQGSFAQGPGAAASVHAVAHAFGLSFADRAQLFGDADFVQVPIAELTSSGYLDTRWKTFEPEHARLPDKAGMEFREGNETTHFSVVDRNGGAVGITTTINDTLGSAFVAPGTGVVLNNEMDDFSIQPGVANTYGLVGAKANAIAPGKRPLSSMSPVIVRDGGDVRLVVGAQGGPRITTSVAQVLLNRMIFDLSLPDAVIAPRIHEQWKPPALRYEVPGFPEDVATKLRSWGYSATPEQTSSARVHAIERFRNGRVWGVADPRGEGNAVAE